MANTYTLISSVTVGAGGASTIDFSSIPSTYTDLKLVLSARNGDTGGGAATVKFNADGTTTNYNYKRLVGTGSTTLSSGANALFWLYTDSQDWTANTFGSGEMYVPNYAGSTQKSVSIDSINENNATTVATSFWAGLWSGTAAINQITLTSTVGNFLQYTTAYLYGIKNS